MVYFQSSDTNRKEINTHRRPQIGKLVSVGRFRFVYVFTFRKTVWFLASKKPAIFPINIFILYQNKSIHLSSEGTTRGCSFAKSFFSKLVFYVETERRFWCIVFPLPFSLYLFLMDNFYDFDTLTSLLSLLLQSYLSIDLIRLFYVFSTFSLQILFTNNKFSSFAGEMCGLEV